MAKHSATTTDSVVNFNKIIAAAKKATQRNNVVLHEACSTGKLNFIKTSLDNGADVNHINDNKEFPLLKACRIASQCESEKIIKYLLKRGANTNIQDPYGRTAMSYMAEEGREFHVDMLLSKCDADPSIEDVKGNTPLMYAVSSNNIDIVGHLLGYFLAINFPIDKRNIVGNTPLLLAARLGHIECARMLVELGNANIHLRDLDNFKDAIDWLRVTSPLNLPDFILLDPIEARKRDKRTRRHSTGTKIMYRVLSDFFTDGKIPSCWRSSGKTIQEPKKVSINRTICIVSDSERASPVEISPRSPEQGYDETIDIILNNMSVNDLPTTPVGETPRSMFDISTVKEVRAEQVEHSGRFIERSDSVLSIMSAPSPTHPMLDDPLQFAIDETPESPVSPTPTNKNRKDNPNKGQNTNRKMERRRSVDNSLFSRTQISSPVTIAARRNNRSTSVSSSLPDNINSDPLATARIKRSGKDCKNRKTSLPHITKNNNMVAADGCISI